MKNMMKNYNLSRMQKDSLYAEAMVIVYWIKKHFYTMNLRYNSRKPHLLPLREAGRAFIFLCLMMASVGA